MKTIKFTAYRTLEWEAWITLEDDTNEEEAIRDLISRTVSADFNQINEEYAELESGARIDII